MQLKKSDLHILSMEMLPFIKLLALSLSLSLLISKRMCFFGLGLNNKLSQL